MTIIDRKKRPRRIASDEAHAWARNLRLNNTMAKFVLMILAGYVDGDGVCFVSINAIADDTELSAQTIRSKLAWLENEVGVIARAPQYIDEYGRRNSEGKGRRTSDNIRLLIDLDQDAVEARARGDSPDQVDPQNSVDPQNVTESQIDPQNSIDRQDRTAPHVDPQVAPHVDPQHTTEGLISEPEPEPESPPKAPLAGGVCEGEGDLVLSEPEHFAEFWRHYPGREVMSRYRSLEVFVTMTPAEQEHARYAAPELAGILAKMKRRPRDAHKWLAEKGFKEFPNAIKKPAPVTSQRRMIEGAELDAVQIALRIAGRQPLSVSGTYGNEGGSDKGFWTRPINPDFVALAAFKRVDERSWQFVEDGSQNCRSWRDRLAEWLGGDIDLVKKWTEDYDAAVHGLPGSDPNWKARTFVRGLYVPGPFPPSQAGKIYTTPTGPPSTPTTLMSDQDNDDFVKEGTG